MEKFAEFVLRFRTWILAAIILVTAVFAFGVSHIRIGTNLTSLLPTHDPFVQTQFAYEKLYGGPLQVRVIVVADSGSILTPEGVEKIARVHNVLDATPGINHEQVISIVSRKLRIANADEYGVTVEPLVDLNKPLPATAEQIAALRARVAQAPGVKGVFVAIDESATIVQGTLIEGAYDIPEVFSHLQKLAQAESGHGFKIHLLGDPVLSGWVYTYNASTFLILGLSIAGLLICLYWFSRSVPVVMLSVIGSIVSAVWGIGLAGFMGYALDPLVLVIPMLIAARTLSHSAQMGIRYIELMHEGVAPREAAVALIKKQFNPGTIGILADAVAIFVLALTDIPLVQQLAIFAGMWCISAVFSVMILGPIMASYMPDQSGLYEKANKRLDYTTQHHRMLSVIARISLDPKWRPAVWVVIVLLTLVGVYGSVTVPLGDTKPGTSLLREDSPYNQADRELRRRFLAAEDLVVVVEPRAGHDVRAVDALRMMDDLQEKVEKQDAVQGSISFSNMVPEVRRLMSANHPKFATPPQSQTEAGMLTELLIGGAAPGDFDRFFAGDYSSASIRFFVRDRLAGTIDQLMPELSQAVTEINAGTERPAQLRMAMGSVAVQAATNHEVEWSHYVTWVLAVATIAITCYIGFQSWTAVGILLVPLLLTNALTMAIMTAMDIGLSVNTLPIGVVGMGVGIDYGIYLLYRVIEERKAHPEMSLEDVIRRSLFTSGRAIYFTAVTMVMAMLLWPLVAQLHYQAVIGLLLAVVLLVNFVGAIIVIPVMLVTFRPAFLSASVITNTGKARSPKQLDQLQNWS